MSAVQGSFGTGAGGQLLGGIAGAGLGLLFGKLLHKKETVSIERVIEPLAVFPRNLDYSLAAAPVSSLFGGRAFLTGASVTIQFSKSSDPTAGKKLVTSAVDGYYRDINRRHGV
jgi:hypothetical protein